MNKDFNQWCQDFNLSKGQAEQLCEECRRCIEDFRENFKKPPHSEKETRKRIDNLLHALKQIGEEEVIQFVVDCSSELYAKAYPYDLIRNLILFCEDSQKSYLETRSKGGRPEVVRGRGWLAWRIASALKRAGHIPTKTPDSGAFDRLLRIIYHEVGINTDPDLKSVRDKAVDAVNGGCHWTPID